MAEFSVSADFGGLFDGDLERLANPEPVLREIGSVLVAELKQLWKPEGAGPRTWVMERAFEDVLVEQVGAMWQLGVGDPAMLGNWQEGAPRGTIAEFIRWLREENRKKREEERGRTAKKHEKAMVAYERKLKKYKATTRKAIRLEAYRERVHLVREFKEHVVKFAVGKAAEREAAEVKLYALRESLASRGISYAHQRELAMGTVLRQFKTGFPGGFNRKRFAEDFADMFTHLSATEITFGRARVSVIKRIRYHARKYGLKLPKWRRRE